MTARALPALAALLALAGVCAPALAQTPPQTYQPRAGVYVDPHRYQADQHRYQMDQLRAQADQRAGFARQLALETQLRRMDVEAARQPDIAPPAGYRVLRSPEEERALRVTATERREATQAGVSQIDAWLDRTPQ